MNAIEAARNLGKAIQEDERYAAYDAAVKKTDSDTALQNKIGEFNMLRMQLSQEMSKEDKDADKMTELDTQLKELYNEVMNMPSMKEFNEAKESLDKLLKSVNYIITEAANGDDPMTCPEEPPHECSGSCASCGGCH